MVRRPTRHRYRLPTFVVIAFTFGCVSTRPVPMPAPTDSGWVVQGDLRITDSAGAVSHARQVAVSEGMLVITRPDSVTHWLEFAQVRRIERRHGNGLATISLILGILWLTGHMLYP